MTRRSSINSFTLVELLIVIAILAILAATVVIVINPSELISQARDTQRITDMKAMRSAIDIIIANDPAVSDGADNTVYISIPSNSATCVGVSGLPTLPAGWSYACVSAANLTKVDATGWIPINFNTSSNSINLPALPIDPINDASSGKYYTYATGGSYELTALLESQKKHDVAVSDGGSLPGVLQMGSHIDLTPVVRDNGLVGLWRFDEGTGTTSADASGKWGVATLAGAAWSSSCKRGYCLSFDGIDDNASIAAKTANFSTVHGPASLLVWFNPSSITGTHSMFGDSSPEFQMYTSDATAYGRTNNTVQMGTVSIGNWYFGAVTHDHPMGLINTVIRTYLNGDFIAQGNWSFGGQNGYSNESYYIGGYSGDANFFQGMIDEIRIYNRALSADEVKVIYNATK